MAGFTAKNWKLKLARHPLEDSFSISKNKKIIAVADGVTRDSSIYLPNTETLKGKISFLWNYPNPSPATVAADIFCETFPLTLRDFQNKNETAIKEAFKETNKKIAEWNTKNIPCIDYGANDFAGCVAVGTSEQSDLIHWGYLADCGMAIFDEKGNLKFRTENDGPDKYHKHIWMDKRLENIDWKNPEARKIIRKDYRNNPEEEHSFGVLTGEESALNYVRTGTQELKDRDYLIVYSDGLEAIIFSEKFTDALRKRDIKGMEKLCRKNVRTEGTLVYQQKQKSESRINYRPEPALGSMESKMQQVERDNQWQMDRLAGYLRKSLKN